MDSFLHIKTEEIQTDGTDTYHFHRYEPTPYDVIETLFNTCAPAENDVLVDYGCGLGRLNFYIENRFGLPSVGIEFSEEYYERALQNLHSYCGNKERITFCHCKAEEYLVQPEQTWFYFFNPFSVDIFRKVVNHILDSWQEKPRKIVLVLYYPEDDTIFYLEQHTAFRLIDEIAASDAVLKDRRERFCLYQMDAPSTGAL